MQDERLIELLSGLLDGQLEADEEAELKAGLAASAEARDLHAQMLSDQKAFQALPVLQTPEGLKKRTLLRVHCANPDLGRPWQRGLMAAATVLLVLGLFSYFRPIRTLAHSRLFLLPGRVATRAAEVSQELSLASAGSEQGHLMVSEPMSGRYSGGQIRLALECDAGEIPGGQLSVRLGFDFEGDGQIDLYSESRILDLDDHHGYEKIACVWPQLDGLRDLVHGRVNVEVASADGSPLRVKLAAGEANLQLPFDGLVSVDETVTLIVKPPVGQRQG